MNLDLLEGPTIGSKPTKLLHLALQKAEKIYMVQSRSECVDARFMAVACQHRCTTYAARRVGGCLMAPTFLFKAVTPSLHAPILLRRLRHSSIPNMPLDAVEMTTTCFS